MSGSKMRGPNTKWDTDQDLHMICLLTTLKSSPDVGSVNFKMAELNRVAETFNKEFTVAQKTAPMFAYYIKTHVLLNADII